LRDSAGLAPDFAGLKATPGTPRAPANLKPTDPSCQVSSAAHISSPTACARLRDMHLVPAERTDRRVIDEDRVCAAISSLDPNAIQEWSQRFGLLSDPTRLSLLLCIGAAGPISVTDLSVAVDQNPDTVSQTLRLLRAYGTVKAQRDGRVVRYQLADPTIKQLLGLTKAPVTATGLSRLPPGGQRSRPSVGD
jgi:ArsR family transcriptional regulator, lead/cadmium/zinc/bismuth-responsive transcriptional repressor